MNSYMKQMEESSKKVASLNQQISSATNHESQLRQQLKTDRKKNQDLKQNNAANQSKSIIATTKLQHVKETKMKIDQDLKMARSRTNELRTTSNNLRSQIRKQKENFLGQSLDSLMEAVGGLELFVQSSPEMRDRRLVALDTPEAQPTGAGNGDTPHPDSQKGKVTSSSSLSSSDIIVEEVIESPGKKM